MTRRKAIVFGAALSLLAGLAAARAADESSANDTLADLPRGEWVMVHDAAAASDPSQRVLRPPHGGSTFDTKRGRLILFGSDTHGDDWSNGIRAFDMASLRWLELEPDDPPESYAVNRFGIPVAGANGDRPWAMHGFDAVDYDHAKDRLVVSSAPIHMEPGRFTDAVAALWPKINRHPTWVYEFAEARWRPLRAGPPHFFPNSTAYDSDRGVMLGYRDGGVHELTNEVIGWRQATNRALIGWGQNAVYDSGERALVLFGSHARGNEVVAYFTESGRHQVMPTPGVRPPGAGYLPMAYHAGIGKTVCVIDRSPEGVDRPSRAERTAETWLYDLGEDRWEHLTSAQLPYGVGMNYNLEYDPARELLVLVTDPLHADGEISPAVVWVMRL